MIVRGQIILQKPDIAVEGDWPPSVIEDDLALRIGDHDIQVDGNGPNMRLRSPIRDDFIA